MGNQGSLLKAPTDTDEAAHEKTHSAANEQTPKAPLKQSTEQY
jgi:hypothetical protein